MAIGYRTIILTALAVPLAAAASAFQGDDAPFAIVEGSVINAQNSRTIPRASVVLQGMKGAGSKSVRADGNGHFIFQQVEPGQYRLMAERQGFYSDEHKREYQPMLEVAAGQYLKNVPVRLMPTAVIAGEIVDEYNDPLQNVEVRLLATGTRLGRMYLTIAGKTMTDDRGQYRISGLRPGKYYLVAESQSKTIRDNIFTNAAAGVLAQINASRYGVPVRINVPPTAPDPPFTYPPLFYPATGDFQQAQSLKVEPGEEIEANFFFISAPLVSIRGRVTNGMTGAPAASASVSAYWTEYMEGDGLPARISPQDGTFEIKGLAPGNYTVRASFTEDKENYAGEQTVEVGPHGTQNVEIAALPDFAAAGHVTLGGNAPKELRRILVEFAGPGLLPRVRASANYPEYKFEAQLRPEKRYYADIRNLPGNYYLKSVAISGHEVPADYMIVTGRRGDVELVLSPNGAQIEGRLFDQKDQPTRGSVLLVPDSADIGPPELLRRISADSQGKFAFFGVRPGTYRVVAFESLDLNDEIRQPDFSRKIAGRGDSLIVEENGKYTVQAKLNTQP
jgi:hypothetical protein